MRGLFLLLFLVLVLALVAPRMAAAAELVMFDSPACEWCELWEQEVGVVYPKTEEARVAPLRQVSIHDPRARDLEGLGAVIYTPTFVLMENGREVGRITGYPGEAHFWGLLEEIIGKLGVGIAGCRAGGEMAENRSGERETSTC